MAGYKACSMLTAVGKSIQIAAGLRPVKYIASRPAYAGYKACNMLAT
jgi:hypothetical protein